MNPTITLSARELMLLGRPLVYVLRDPAGRAVYVGVGTRGARRPLDPLHHAIAGKIGHSLEIYCCDNAEAAVRLEADLISYFQPPLNKSRALRHNTARRGLRRLGNGKWQAYVRISGRFVSRVFPADTPPRIMQQWRQAQRGDAARARLTAYLDTPEVDRELHGSAEPPTNP